MRLHHLLPLGHERLRRSSGQLSDLLQIVARDAVLQEQGRSVCNFVDHGDGEGGGLGLRRGGGEGAAEEGKRGAGSSRGSRGSDEAAWGGEDATDRIGIDVRKEIGLG